MLWKGLQGLCEFLVGNSRGNPWLGCRAKDWFLDLLKKADFYRKVLEETFGLRRWLGP